MKKNILSLGACLLSAWFAVAQTGVGINMTGAAPAANTMLDVVPQVASGAYYGIRVNNNSLVVRGDGFVGIGTAAPSSSLNVVGKTTLSRDNVTECCGNDGTLALAENTSTTNRLASISFHNSGSAEGSIALTQSALTDLGISPRRLLFYDNQSQGLGLQLTGGLYYGITNSRTELRNNVNLQGDAGAQSGFFETSAPVNYPAALGQASGNWYHLIDVRHSNPANNYAMQLTGNFFDQDLFMRKTSGNATQPWSRMVSSRDIIYVKNEATATMTTRGSFVSITGASAWMDVRNGDKIKLDGMYYGRLTAGSGDEFFFTRVMIEGQNGCGTNYSNTHDAWQPTEASADHDNFKPVPYMDVWECNCNGQIRVTLQVQVNGDDNWAAREVIVTGTRY